jgi:hypothetical protein
MISNKFNLGGLERSSSTAKGKIGLYPLKTQSSNIPSFHYSISEENLYFLKINYYQ